MIRPRQRGLRKLWERATPSLSIPLEVVGKGHSILHGKFHQMRFVVSSIASVNYDWLMLGWFEDTSIIDIPT